TKAYAGWYGAYDLQYTMDNYAPASNVKKHQRYDVFLNGWAPEYIDSLAPVSIAASKSGLSYKAILFTGTADITIGPDNARRYREALRTAGIKDVKVVTYKNVTHSIGASYAANDMFSKSLRLFAKTL
ncbi:MAG: prolyl oligopeptidase family serine peptidase, partial [Bacteroidales bacterium]|nr:prolyl oligopeptidase family serine peptidase [Bacteroidales bacterium]